MGSKPKVVVTRNLPEATAEVAMRLMLGAARETRDDMGFRALDNLNAIFAGREPGD